MQIKDQNPWQNGGKSISYAGLTIGLATPRKNLNLEVTDPLNLLVLHQESFCGVARVGSRNKISFQTNPGQLWYIPKNTYQNIQSEHSGEMLYMRCGDTLQNRFKEEVGSVQILMEPTDQSPAQQSSRQLSALMFGYLASNGIGGRMYAESLAALLISEVMVQSVEHKQQSPYGLSRKSLNTVFEYVGSNLNRDLSLIRLAEIAGVSVFHFSRMFKQDVGVSPHQYVLQERADRARCLVRDTRTSYVEIARTTGFTSQSHMGNVFRKTLGISPNRYRALHN